MEAAQSTRAGRAAAAALTGTLLCMALSASPAAAGGDVICPPDGGPCTIVVDKPGTGGDDGDDGGEGGGGTSRNCGDALFLGCFKSGLGYYGSTVTDPVGCFWLLADPQPPAGDPVWEGHAPGDGKIYVAACGWPGLTGFTSFWRATPPPGFGGGPSPAELAARAINMLPIRGPQIGTAPAQGGSGLVGLPVWLWTPATEATWGPSSRTASVPGLSVTATARAQKIVWSMGDGASVTCTSPGTPYQASFGNKKSPDCGYAGYAKPSSSAGGRYTVTGVTTWHVTWAGGGQTGEVTVTRSSSTTIDIDELQVITS